MNQLHRFSRPRPIVTEPAGPIVAGVLFSTRRRLIQGPAFPCRPRSVTVCTKIVFTIWIDARGNPARGRDAALAHLRSFLGHPRI